VHVDVTFPGKKRVAARVGSFQIMTDQPKEAGGDASAPQPYDLFLASVGTCAGIYALGFCQARGLSTEGLHLEVDAEHDPKGILRAFHVALTLPRDFPDKYRPAIVRAVEQCKVKKAMAVQPPVDVILVDAEPMQLTGT
jgi:ribosomal protein S12 methylthiotransferase accessory factor